MFQLSFFLAFVYLLWRFVWPLPWRARWRVMLGMGMLVASQWYLIQRLVFGTMFSPELPRPLVMLMGGLFVAFVMLAVLVMALDVLLALVWLARRLRPLPRCWRTRAHGALAAAVLASTAWGVAQGVQVPQVKRVELAVPGLPEQLAGFRLVQLTDLHLSRLLPGAWMQQVVARTNALAPDLIVITGDLIDGTPAARVGDVAPLAGLRARHGVLASLGNHEYYFGTGRWSAEFQRLGLRVLDNEHEVIDHEGARLLVAAIGDQVASGFGWPAPDLAQALQGAPTDVPLVLLSHRPILTPAHAAAGVDLQLSGHTHGGMVRGPLQWLVRRANDGFVSGLYAVGRVQLYVSNGTGLWNGFPVRLGVPGEITEFVLSPAAG